MNLSLPHAWALSTWQLRAATAVLAVLLLCNLVAFFAYRTVEGQRPELASQLEQANRMLAEMQAARNPAAIKTALAETEARLINGDGVVPPALKEAELLEAVVAAADSSGTSIASLKATDSFTESIEERQYQAQRYHIEAFGSFDSVVAMLPELEANLRPSVVMESVILEPQAEGWGLSFDLVAYARGA